MSLFSDNNFFSLYFQKDVSCYIQQMNYPCAHSGMFFTTGDLKGALITNTGFKEHDNFHILHFIILFIF